jgi:hypothetical protein
MNRRFFQALFSAIVLCSSLMLPDTAQACLWSGPLSKESACVYHFATNIDPYNRILVLEDGSEWKVSSYDDYFWMYWHLGDNIIVTPNYFYSDYTYYMTNQETGEYVRANLVTAPIRGGPYTAMITGFSCNRNRPSSIYLNNGTCWAVSEKDLSHIQNWQIEDLVIMGKNNEWFSYNTHIIINIHTNTFVRVRKL